MARRAAWRAQPDDPRTPLGWFLADADARTLRMSVALALALALAGLAMLWNPWPLLALPLIALHTRIPARPRDLAPLMTTPPPGPAFACRLQSMTDVNPLGWGALLGNDEGIATFVDGWLHYAGCRTEFALRYVDLQDTSALGGRRFLQLDTHRWVVIEPLDERDADFFGRALRVWADSTPTPAGESLFPPDAVHSSGLARAWCDAFGFVAASLAAIGVLCAISPTTVVFLFIVGSGGLTPLVRLRAIRRRAREEGLAGLDARPYPALRDGS